MSLALLAPVCEPIWAPVGQRYSFTVQDAGVLEEAVMWRSKWPEHIRKAGMYHHSSRPFQDIKVVALRYRIGLRNALLAGFVQNPKRLTRSLELTRNVGVERADLPWYTHEVL